MEIVKLINGCMREFNLLILSLINFSSLAIFQAISFGAFLPALWGFQFLGVLTLQLSWFPARC